MAKHIYAVFFKEKEVFVTKIIQKTNKLTKKVTDVEVKDEDKSYTGEERACMVPIAQDKNFHTGKIKETLESIKDKFPEEWISVKLRGKTYTKEEVNKILKGK